MINRILILSFAATLVLFCSGCFSMMTWRNTGEIITNVENVRVEYTGPEELTVHSTGWQEKAYLRRFDWATMENVPWEQHIVLPLTRMPDEQTGEPVDIEINVNPRERRFYKTESGLWSMQEDQYDSIHPDDIPHLSEPYIARYRRLIIPLEVWETKDGRTGGRKIHVEGYEACQVRFPGEETREFVDYIGIRLLQCCLLPVAIALDAATSPIQVYLFAHAIGTL